MKQIFEQLKLRIIAEFKSKATPLIASAAHYWQGRSDREQSILKAFGLVVLISLLFIVVSSALDWQRSLTNGLISAENDYVNVSAANLQLKDLSLLSANNSSTPTVDKIREDVVQLFNLQSPNVALTDSDLTVQLSNVKFDLALLFLDQIRKSYELFPITLKITRSSSSGYVNCNITYHLED